MLSKIMHSAFNITKNPENKLIPDRLKDTLDTITKPLKNLNKDIGD